MKKVAAYTLVAIAVAIAIYGVIHERLLDQPIWNPTGTARFAMYAAAFWSVALLLIILRPPWLALCFAIIVACYTVWRCGAIAPLAVLYFLGSCFLLGKILFRRAQGLTALFIGLAAWLFAISIAVHFPINTRWTYLVAFAIPYVVRAFRPQPDSQTGIFFLRLGFASRRDTLALAAFLFVLLAHWLVALLPEVSADGLAMHLTIPMSVEHNRLWSFDFRQYAWALMPMGGDWAYTAVYLLGGEAAARLLNFAMLCAIVAVIYREAWRWLAPAQAWLTAALFVSTPLVQLATGSMFVENIWAAMLLVAVVELVQGELIVVGILFGAALSIKVGTAAFLAPAAIVFALRSRGRLRPALAGIALLIVLGAPPYLNAWRKTGNPVFPFANQVFKSPYFDAAPLQDSRYREKPHWTAPYDVTFRSSLFYEGQNGGLGFQYFLLLPAALLLLRRDSPAAIAGIALAGAALSFGAQPNLRYLYPALPLFSLLIAWMIAELRWIAGFAAVVLAANVWFLESSGWYHKDFAAFTRADAQKYYEIGAPQRTLIDRLNREAPGEPTAFFGGAAIAGLHAPAYSDSWHSHAYWMRMAGARSGEEAAAVLRDLGIRRLIAPVPLERWQTPYPSVDNFLDDWTELSGTPINGFGIMKIRATPLHPDHDREPAPPGAYDDWARWMLYRGAWMRDRQFSQASAGTLTYSDTPGDWIRFWFAGRRIVYVYTKALNRGIAQVLIDGEERARLDLYSPDTQWQARSEFGNLPPGRHVIEIRVLESANPKSSDRYVDLDGFIVE